MKSTAKIDFETKQTWFPLFIDFLGYLSVETKDYGVIKLKDCLLESQVIFLENICKGLDDDVHHFVNLKARQLGISTISLALDLFWLMVHDNTQGALICDTDGNREKFRLTLEKYIESLPAKAKVKIVKHNRTCLVLENGSVLDYLVAGVRKNSNLGRGRALNFLHATECSSYGDAEAVSSLMATLSEKHPNRLYIFESTAKGFNLFWDMWESAKEDEETQRAFFAGWWAKESYSVEKDSELYKKYWVDCPDLSEDEKHNLTVVERDYGIKVKPEQIAWYRWKAATRVQGEGMMKQEYPWTAEEAFISTGRGFFPKVQLADNIKFILDNGIQYLGFYYKMTDNMGSLELLTAQTRDQVELRMWEKPHKDGKYVIGIDPSYGGSADCDNHVIEIFRCYADKLVQVAEYTTSIPETYQITWVLAHLAAIYGDCLINLEVFGPGKAIMQELKHQKQLVMMGAYPEISAKPDMQNALASAKWYMYNRPDSPGAGYAYNFSTTSDNKLTMLNQMRDCYITNQLEIRSYPLLSEMQTMEQDGYSVQASGRHHDDRVMATAFAIKAWVDWVRASMLSQGRTMRYELDRIEALKGKKESPFHQQMLTGFFNNIEAQQEAERIAILWGEDY